MRSSRRDQRDHERSDLAHPLKRRPAAPLDLTRRLLEPRLPSNDPERLDAIALDTAGSYGIRTANLGSQIPPTKPVA